MEIKEKIESLIKEVLNKEYPIIEDFSFAVEHPEDFKNGDYSTNVAMVYAKQLKMSPKDLADKIVEFLRSDLKNSKRSDLGGGLISEIQVAPPGFINFYLSREFFIESIGEILKQGDNWGKNNLLAGKKVMVEYTQPNPFKPFHIGHLMSNAIGESISRIFEYSQAKVIRANYQGDVGPHVAKAIWGIIHSGEKIKDKNVIWIGECYTLGATLYESSHSKGLEAKKEIDEINKKVYDHSDSKINETYNWGRKITLEAFEEIYKTLGTKFDKYYFESEMAPKGEKVVKKNIGKVFEKSEGAIIFPANKYDSKLHTRVFINSQGLPTYETKEIGLTLTKFKKGILDKGLDLSVVTTAIEQAEYMKVVQKAISLMYPKLERKMKHITHGMMKFADGKMSSRKGNIITGESLLKDSVAKVIEIMNNSPLGMKTISVSSDKEILEKGLKTTYHIANKIGVAALKYSILKSSLGSDIIYDQEKSISFDGDSGPYLQYSAVRANSILEKSKAFLRLDLKNSKRSDLREIPNEITDLEKLLYQFPEVVEYSYRELTPHHITTYLIKIASEFNTFYANTQILPKEDPEGKNTSYGAGNKYIEYYLGLTEAFYITMKNGLYLLGIEIPERM